MNVQYPDIGRLGHELGEIYRAAPHGEKVVSLHLFGIVHADEIGALTNRELEHLAHEAGLGESFATELRKMVKLSRHVVIKRVEDAPSARAPAAPVRQSVFRRLARPMPEGFTFDREEANAR